MRTSKKLLLGFLLIAAHSVLLQAQEIRSNITRPCAGMEVAYYFAASNCVTVTGIEFQNVDPSEYTLVSKTTETITVIWKKVPASPFASVGLTARCGTNPAIIPVTMAINDVRAAGEPMPVSTLTVSCTEAQEAILKVNGYSQPIRWSQNATSLGAAYELNLGRKAPGTYTYKGDVITLSGECPTMPGAVTSVTVTLNVTAATDAQYNFIESTSYSESPEIAHSKSYFDAMGRLMQSQSRIYTSSEIAVSQPIRDSFDRPVVQTLAAPTGVPTFGFRKNFVLDASGGSYDEADFDMPVQSSVAGTLGFYYGGSNTRERDVPVTGFPYTRIEYADDGTGDVRRSGSAGDQHRINAGHETVVATFPIRNELDIYYDLRTSLSTNFRNQTFQGETMLPWEPLFPPGNNSVQQFTWMYNGNIAADATSSGYSDTGYFGQKRGNGQKWPAGEYQVTISAGNYSTGGLSPLTSGLAVGASDNPSSAVTALSVTGDNTINVGSSKTITASFVLDKDYEYILFRFTKSGPTSGYKTKIHVSSVNMIKAGGILQTSGNQIPIEKGVQKVARDVNGKLSVNMQTKDGRAVMSAIPGSPTDYVVKSTNYVSNVMNCDFYLFNEQSLTIPTDGTVTIKDLVTGNAYNPAADGDAAWEVGFYRLSSLTPSVTFNFTNYFKNVSYSFYNDGGKLTTSVSPNGVIQLNSGVALQSVDKSSYVYDFRGNVQSMSETDAGITNYMYRKDGIIRFSQNAEQAKYTDGRFSYTNYDYLSRPIESGEYKVSASTAESEKLKWNSTKMLSILEDITATGGLTGGEKTDWISTYYDYPDASIPNLPTDDFVQTYVNNAVSYTFNQNNKTWYSYDEFGRVKWMAQKPSYVDKTFVLQYTYDLLGKVLKVENAIYNSEETRESVFYHHYVYDLDQRLSRVYTSLDDVNKTLRATYSYFLHGPLKRIELGDKLQGIDFVYNINGWLTQINHPDKAQDPGGDTNDVFGMLLDYYESSLSGLLTASTSPAQLIPSMFHHLPNLNNNEGDLLAANYSQNENLRELQKTFTELRKEYRGKKQLFEE